MNPENNKAALLAVRERLDNTEAERRAELASLRNAKEEQRQALDGIARVFEQNYNHPMDLVTIAEGVWLRLRNFREKTNDQAVVLMKIFRMVKSTGGSWERPDEVIAEVASFIARNSKGQAEEFRQQLENETKENMRLRKLVSSEEARTAQANANAHSFREECRVAQKNAEDWRVRVNAAEQDLRKTKTMHAEAVDAQRKLERRIEELTARLAAAKRSATPSALRALLKADPASAIVADVTEALRDAMDRIRSKKLPTNNSARFIARFNDGMELGASFVEAAVYSALPSKKT